MAWCPECRLEYVQGILSCPDCNVPLVPQLPEEELNLSTYADMVSVSVLDNEVQGAVLKSVLEEQGIHAIVRDFIVSQHQLPEAGMNAWGELLVLEPDFDNAKFIITEYLNSLDIGVTEEEDGSSEDSKDEPDDFSRS
jgi:hypothetical protein